MAKEWRDYDTMHHMYVEKEMSSREIAEKMDCCATTVKNWLHKHDLPIRDSNKDKAGYFGYSQGYARFGTTVDGKSKSVGIHRLVAIAKYGIEAVMDNVVHHKNGVKWDNRPCNLEVMSRRDHALEHDLPDKSPLY